MPKRARTATPNRDMFRDATLSQGFGALAMLRDCIELCPDDKWDEPIGIHPYWLNVYHTLGYTDLYCARSVSAWVPTPRFHPAGRAGFQGWNPGRRFEREELLAYTELCRKKFRAAFDAETPATFRAASGFPWVKLPRYELYPYSTRHVQHHVGQLSAVLRRLGIAPTWRFRARS